MSALPRALRYPALLMLCLVLVTCMSAVSFDQATLRVTPSKLADSDSAQFQPQLISASGSVRVRYQGPRKFFQVSTLVWKDRQWQVSAGATGPASVPLERQVSVILHDTSITSGDTQYKGIVADRAADQLRTIPFAISKVDAPAAQGKPLELRSVVEVPDDEPVTIWGYAVYGDSPPPATDGPIEQRAEQAAYAVIVIVRMVDHMEAGNQLVSR